MLKIVNETVNPVFLNKVHLVELYLLMRELVRNKLICSSQYRCVMTTGLMPWIPCTFGILATKQPNQRQLQPDQTDERQRDINHIVSPNNSIFVGSQSLELLLYWNLVIPL
ncbi:hypothetical protein SJAG_04636 [Schizosaccharomyces japonicus yFS275]|uniref:Uncharacterized protein n=1 Tax=Schizosaccharomyces japonicus (strain yFS275 / FY16936) TaxID=402676 RepID=B6K7C8_SCHJY|nr:hypothetical protein SJAG_04636 [Schizosaccharomyces japonicus yFS275]EEB09432.2 hypothetical protein SJAG_04636 [Schizosaccharomyces japonicus yFS275]